MRYRHLNRLSAFSDAVVSIAMTLLVLPLVDIVPEVRDKPLGLVLRENSSAFFAFALSFYLIAFFWLIHHRVFEQILRLDWVLVNLNFCWLFGIVFLPVSTMVVAAGDASPTASPAFYVSNLLFICLMNFAMTIWASRHPDLRREVTPADMWQYMRRGASVCLVMALALAVTPFLESYALLLLLLTPLVTRIGLRYGRQSSSVSE